MVATRNHPTDFEAPSPEPAAKPSPSKRTTHASLAPDTISSTRTMRAEQTSTPRKRYTVSTRDTPSYRDVASAFTRQPAVWEHTPSNLTLIWLAISLPLVIWDTGYVLLRPWSMPGGFLHAPIWSPYELYGRVDHVYGFKAWDARNGWTAAQGSINAVETAVYLLYLYIVYAYGEPEAVQGRGAPEKSALAGRWKALSESRTLRGRLAALAVVLCFSTALVTFAKTVLYWLIEVFSGFESIGHNDWLSLLFLWIIPNGAWLVFPCYMIYVFGSEILQGLEAASTGDRKAR